MYYFKLIKLFQRAYRNKKLLKNFNKMFQKIKLFDIN